MTSSTFKRSGPRLSARKLTIFEEDLGCELPAEYRAFLLRHNGGVPNRTYFRHSKDAFYAHYVTFLFFVDDNLATPTRDANVSSIAFWRFVFSETSPGNIPNDCLVIGKDDLDNPILLRLRGRKKGHVELKLVPEDYQPPQDPEDDIYPLQKSFNRFLESLRSTESEVL